MSGGRTGAAPPAPNAVSIKSLEVPQALQEGEKFIKWDEDSGVGTPVTLRVDTHGFYLYWADQNHEMDLLDIATIRDTRTSRYAKIPREFMMAAKQLPSANRHQEMQGSGHF